MIDNTEQSISVRRIQRNFRRKQARLVRALDLGTITPDQYVIDFTLLLKGMMVHMRETLGEERFIAVFGEAGRNPESLIDREAFMDAMAERTS